MAELSDCGEEDDDVRSSHVRFRLSAKEIHNDNDSNDARSTTAQCLTDAAESESTPQASEEVTKSENRPQSVRRKFRTLTFGRRYATKSNAKETPKKRSRGSSWNFKFKYRLKRCGLGCPASDIPELGTSGDSCICTSYRRTEDHHLGAGVVFQTSPKGLDLSLPSNSKVLRTKGLRRSPPSSDDIRIASNGGDHRASMADSPHGSSSLLSGMFSRSSVSDVRHSSPEDDCLVQVKWPQLMTSRNGRSLPISQATALRLAPSQQTLVTRRTSSQVLPIVDLVKFNPEEYPGEAWEIRAFIERAREIEEGVDPPPGFRPSTSPLAHVDELHPNDLASSFQNRLAVGAQYTPRQDNHHSDPALSSETHLISQFARVTSQGAFIQRTVHTQVDYIHCLVPDLLEITSCGFYWGKMDRYEAEKLLENKPEGTFLLRDSAQEEYLFSVSFRRYFRSLHARIEQWNHKFSFDSHDPGVFASDTVCGLIEHYKDPSCCMFFEPMLTIPLHRTFTFPLQHLCRSVICKASSYDGINHLRLPKRLKAYLKEYHYKQRVRVRRFEVEH